MTRRPTPALWAGFAAILFFADPLSFSLRAAEKLVSQELFQTIGALDSGTPGTLGTVSGPFVKRPVGPRTASVAAPGWSAEIPGINLYHDLDLTSGPGASARDTGMFGAWYYFSSVPTDGVNVVRLINLENALGGGNQVTTITIDTNFNLSLTFYDTPNQQNITTLSPNTWYWIAVAWHDYPVSGGISYDATWFLRKAGGPLTVMGTPVKDVPMGAYFQTVEAGAANAGGYAAIIARYGAPSLYALDAFSDAAYPPGLIPPVVERHAWYVNPATGNDSYSGQSPARAWKSAGKINEEAQNLGILSTSGGCAKGDVLVIDTSLAPLQLGNTSLSIPTDGISICPAAGQRYAVIQADTTISASSWTKTTGQQFTYQTADTDQDIVLWENDRWLNHPTGASVSDIAAYLDSTPGSFWTDGQTLYLHPFNNTDPSSDHKTYTRSQYRGSGDSAIGMAGNNWLVTGLRVRKTCLADPGSNDPIGAYCFQQTGPSVSGTCTIENSYLDYGSKHIVGFTADSTDSTVLAENLLCEQASPYALSGGQSPFVSFMSNGSGNIHIYRNCTSIHNAGLIGYTTGTASAAYPAFITHGSTTAYKSLQFLNCHLACGPFNDQGTTIDGGLVIRNSQLMDVGFASPNVLVQNCRIQGSVGFSNGGTLEDSQLVSNVDYTASSPAELAGNVIIRDCLLDLRTNPTPRGGRFSPFGAADSLSLTFENNQFLVPKTSDLTLINYLTSADTLLFSSNTYSLGAESLLIGTYNGQSQTFQQWQALGFDSRSKLTYP
jgi:hypothetical protein